MHELGKKLIDTIDFVGNVFYFSARFELQNIY